MYSLATVSFGTLGGYSMRLSGIHSYGMVTFLTGSQRKSDKARDGILAPESVIEDSGGGVGRGGARGLRTL